MRSKHSALGARALVVAVALAAGGAFAGCSEADQAAATPTEPVASSRSADVPRTTIAGAALRDQSTDSAANDSQSN
jgi:hypothetical protein